MNVEPERTDTLEGRRLVTGSILTATNQGISKIAAPPEAKRKERIALLPSPESEHGSATTSTSDF